jgi:hypothetical protein
VKVISRAKLIAQKGLWRKPLTALKVKCSAVLMRLKVKLKKF